jgi:hypothetical protein
MALSSGKPIIISIGNSNLSVITHPTHSEVRNRCPSSPIDFRITLLYLLLSAITIVIEQSTSILHDAGKG